MQGSDEGNPNRLYFSAKNITIYNADILHLDAIDEGSIDLIVTSPPYNVDIDYEGYKDDIPYDKYLEFTERWLSKCYTLAKGDGRICLNIPLDKSKGRGGKKKGWRWFPERVCRYSSSSNKEGRLEVPYNNNME
ncbi:MAG: DNA methyltransferase [Candidatus Nitrosocaldus sp.]